jgi:hypothetical protein
MELEEAPMTIVVGFDQHRAQITTEWLDSMTGEIGRARIAPADSGPAGGPEPLASRRYVLTRACARGGTAWAAG